jgi:acetyl esterase/lipase
LPSSAKARAPIWPQRCAYSPRAVAARRSVHQTLLYPCVDATLSSPSMDDGPPGFQKKDIAQLIELYRDGAALTDPLLSPLYAENHAQLPPALIITGDLDPARDDGDRYAQCLAAAGVPVRYLNYPGMPHAFFFMPRICEAEAEARAQISAELVALSRVAQ